MKKIRIVENPSELGAGTRGSSLGIEAIRIAAINKESLLFYDNEVTTLNKNNKKLFKKVDTPHAIRIKQIYKRIKELGDVVFKSVYDKEFPIIFSGDHSSASGIIAGIKKKFPDKRVGVIWIDAHADLHTPYTTPSGNVHGMPLAIALGIDNQELKRNKVVDKTLDYWEKCKNLYSINPKINYEDIVFIALRSIEKEEESQIKDENIKIHSVDDVNQNGTEKIVNDTLSYLSGCDAIFISFDVDSLDPDKTSDGTGTPVPKGLLPTQVVELLCGLVNSTEKIKALEVCEINPLLDNKNVMAETTLKIIEETIKCLKS